MPAERNEQVLPLVDDLKEDVQEVLQKTGECIAEVRNFGTQVLNLHRQLEGGDEKVGIAMLLRRSVELIDAIGIQLSQGSVDPTKMQFRVLLEATFYLKFIFDEQTTNRSLAFRYWRLLQLKDYYERRDANDQTGQQYFGEMGNDELFGEFADELSEQYEGSSDQIVDQIEQDLHKPVFEDVRQEYERLNDDRDPEWFEAFGGRNSIEQIAQLVGMHGMYNQFYSRFSDSIHSTDVFTGIKQDPDDEVYVNQIRYLEELPKIAILTSTFGYLIYKEFFENELIHQMDEFQEWVDNDFRHIYDILLEINKIFQVES